MVTHNKELADQVPQVMAIIDEKITRNGFIKENGWASDPAKLGQKVEAVWVS